MATSSASHLFLCSPPTSSRHSHAHFRHAFPYVSPSGIASIAAGKQLCSFHSFSKRDINQLLQSSRTGFRRCSEYCSAAIVSAMSKPVIQFIRGVDEFTVPDVSLTRSRDQTNGVATFVFDQPSIFDSSRELGDITGFYMIDEEEQVSIIQHELIGDLQHYIDFQRLNQSLA
ncbi:hypothetical protein O6H91_17G049500 [Diphasiastrum complanatum]|uniref:Uncharacterized protein n=1 Tax=Diphasiastrum complanatum TaxID=34168 RepID=A0ACC2B6P2_DIPCM|nr:hypothetical protein O6H91_17G049500 [Diphasiastrum complanatum]